MYTPPYFLYDFICELSLIYFVNYLQTAYQYTVSHFYGGFCDCKEKLYPIA